MAVTVAVNAVDERRQSFREEFELAFRDAFREESRDVLRVTDVPAGLDPLFGTPVFYLCA